MAKEVTKIIKLQIAAGAATPAPPVGTVLGPAGVDRALDHVYPLLAARREELGEPFDLAWHVNVGDAYGLAPAWQQRFPAVRFHRHAGEGGHPFADYDENGLVTRSFAFVLERL